MEGISPCVLAIASIPFSNYYALFYNACYEYDVMRLGILELQNQVTQNDVILRVKNSNS